MGTSKYNDKDDTNNNYNEDTNNNHNDDTNNNHNNDTNNNNVETSMDVQITDDFKEPLPRLPLRKREQTSEPILIIPGKKLGFMKKNKEKKYVQL